MEESTGNGTAELAKGQFKVGPLLVNLRVLLEPLGFLRIVMLVRTRAFNIRGKARGLEGVCAAKMFTQQCFVVTCVFYRRRVVALTGKREMWARLCFRVFLRPPCSHRLVRSLSEDLCCGCSSVARWLLKVLP